MDWQERGSHEAAVEAPARPLDFAAADPRDLEGLRAANRILTELFGPAEQRSFAVQLWDGSLEQPGAGRGAAFTLVLRRPDALRRLVLLPSTRALGEAYVRDDFDVEGDIEAAVAVADRLMQSLGSPAQALKLAARLRALSAVRRPASNLEGVSGRRRGRRHSRGRDAASVRFHYDIGDDFYALWLDRAMVYSCAYFESGKEDLDTAQEAKLDLVCRKLRLSPGDRLLDIGCGWGSLLIHAADRYGVRATGITLSRPQAETARRRIDAAGLGERCRVEVRDYRELPATARFDKIASIGMVEHVGQSRLPDYFANAYRLLEPGGLFLNHGIVGLAAPARGLRRLGERISRPWTSFVERYVFPDGELVTPAETIGPAEAAGFETRDVESLREHYALTLRHWVGRLETRREEAVQQVGEERYRVWRLYMAGSAHYFATGQIGVIQTLFGKRDETGALRLPPTRSDLYVC